MPKKETPDIPPENLSATHARMARLPNDEETDFSDAEIQEFMDGFRGVQPSSLLPHFTIHRLLVHQKRSEVVILKALLNSMAKVHLDQPPRPAIAQNGLVPKLAEAVPLFSDSAIRASAAEFDALGMTPRQIGSLPGVAGAFGILGKSRLPVIKAIVDGFATRNLNSGPVGEDYFQYLSALQGLCAMGSNASSMLPILQTMSKRDQLWTARDPMGASTVITLLRLGASLDDYRPVLGRSGWTKQQLDVFGAETYEAADCMDLNRGRSILIRHPLIEIHWPFVVIRENMTTKF